MLISKDNTGKTKAVFSCDRCKVNIEVENRYIIYIQTYKNYPKKAYDLCEKCYNSLKRGISKGVQR